MCCIEGTGAGRIGKFKLLKGNKVTMTLKDNGNGNICWGMFGKKKEKENNLLVYLIHMPENGYRFLINLLCCSPTYHVGNMGE